MELPEKTAEEGRDILKPELALDVLLLDSGLFGEVSEPLKEREDDNVKSEGSAELQGLDDDDVVCPNFNTVPC